MKEGSRYDMPKDSLSVTMNQRVITFAAIILTFLAFLSFNHFADDDIQTPTTGGVVSKSTGISKPNFKEELDDLAPEISLGKEEGSFVMDSSEPDPAPNAVTAKTYIEGLIDDPTVVQVQYTNNSGLTQLAGHFFSGRVCKNAQGNFTDLDQYNTHTTLVNISFNCYDLFSKGAYGTGNFITAFYGVRMMAHSLGTTNVVILCSDAEEQKKDLILPWMMGYFGRLGNDDPENEEKPEPPQACSEYKKVPIGYQWRDMLFELRRMAIAMVGIPSPDHPAGPWAEENLWSAKATDPTSHRHGRDWMQLQHPLKGDQPLFPGTKIDDAILHFRCGDIIMSNHPSFGFMKFGSFSRHVSPDAKSIGIVTQPFEAAAQQRGAEGGQGKRDRCKTVVYAFIDHLKKAFPKAEINLHNSIDETIALTFARMIMANQTVIGITSFGVFPGVTTFGTGYIRYPDYMKAPNRWLLTSPILKHVNNVKLIEEPRLMAGRAKGMYGSNGSALIEWFENYDMP